MAEAARKLNLVYVFADQWRARAVGYAGDPNVKTPHIDALARESLNLTHAVAGTPVCSPYRATLLTGQYPHTHGIFVNDVPLDPGAVSLGDAFAGAGYDTGYIGKWHLDGHGRSNFIPRERRQGFDYWKVLECTHDYNNSHYFADDEVMLRWDGYDAIAQTRDAQTYLRGRATSEKPFLLVLSWGPPHNPYETAPEEFRDLYDPAKLTLPPNVPADAEEMARRDLAGYYAHCSTLDSCVGDLLETLRESGLDKDTIFIFTSDHGDMLGSQGHVRKQRPWDESIRVPFLMRHPGAPDRMGAEYNVPFNSPDIMPTLLGLCGIEAPDTVEGTDYSSHLLGETALEDNACLISCYAPFGEFQRAKHGGREYRGVRTRRYTYVRDLNGPWLFYDNESDPYQLENLCGKPETAAVEAEMERLLRERLEEMNDAFMPAARYYEKWGYKPDANGTVPYTP